mgnify:CR=1 FL=1|tara:strand:+ start:221 stop:484 length:264 start_codon:yes stop_codon:yes gene_type:complete
MTKKNKKKMGYKQYEQLLALAHKKCEILAERYKELQIYFMEYIDFNDHNTPFNNWMEERSKKRQAEIAQQENANKDPNIEKQVHEKV